jgi:hypothetical protein
MAGKVRVRSAGPREGPRMKQMAGEVYTVWGGDPDQDSADHYATFRDLDYARAYRKEMLRANHRLRLGIYPTKPVEGEECADEEWEARFSAFCTSGCRNDPNSLCGLCGPLFSASSPNE